MGRSAAVLLLTLVLGACVAANADGGKRNDYTYDREPREKQCRLTRPWRYNTYGCPKCKTNDGCIKTECSEKYEGKADVTINLTCLFGEKIGFVAVSYDDTCVNNQKGYGYGTEIKLENLKCDYLPKLRFIVQNRWWFNPYGKDLERSDVCYDKCTKGKPCHTCVFKDIYIPKCKKHCKKDLCDYDKKKCPKKVDHCFDYKPYEKYVKVTLKKECQKKYSHVAVSYYDKYYKPASIDTHSDDYKELSFKAHCKSPFKWFFEDDYYVNKYAPKYPSEGDKCYDYFKEGKVCDQCGPFEGYIGKCKEPYYPDKEHEKPEHKKPFEKHD